MIRGIIYMIIVGICWTVYGVVMGFAPKRKLDVRIMLFLIAFSGVVASGAIGLATGLPKGVPALPYFITFAALTVCGALNYVQLHLMSKAMENGPNSIIWSLIQSAFVFPFIIGVLFFHSRCVFWNAAGATCILLALLMLALGQDSHSTGPWKLMAFISMFNTGISQTLSNMPSYFPEAENVSSTWRTTYFFLGLAIGSIICTMISFKGQFYKSILAYVKRTDMWLFTLLLLGIEIVISILLLYPGMNMLADAGAGAIAYPLVVASGIVAFDMYSLIILHERHTLLQKLALLLILTGIAGLCA